MQRYVEKHHKYELQTNLQEFIQERNEFRVLGAIVEEIKQKWCDKHQVDKLQI